VGTVGITWDGSQRRALSAEGAGVDKGDQGVTRDEDELISEETESNPSRNRDARDSSTSWRNEDTKDGSPRRLALSWEKRLGSWVGADTVQRLKDSGVQEFNNKILSDVPSASTAKTPGRGQTLCYVHLAKLGLPTRTTDWG